MAAWYLESDADEAALDGQVVAILGYGNLGRPVALNLRDSGITVLVGSREDADAERARGEGFEVVPIAEAMARGDVVWFALPDEVIAGMLSTGATATAAAVGTATATAMPTDGDARPSPGSLLCFSSGYALAFGLVKLPDDVDIVLLAPRMIGSRIRALYTQERGFFSYVSVEQDASGSARERLLALASAVGTLRAGALEVSAADEAALDLYVEQTVGPLLGAAVLGAFEVGTAAGFSPEALALELYLSGEMGATWDAFAAHGFFPGVRLHGYAAAFGGFLRLATVDQAALKQQFAETLEDIQSGAFARRFQAELEAGMPTKVLVDQMVGGDDPLSRAEATLRSARRRSAPHRTTGAR